MTARKPAVATISMIRAPTSVIPWPGAVIPFVTACWLTATATTRAAKIAPMICDRM